MDTISIGGIAPPVKGELSSTLENTLTLVLNHCKEKGFAWGHNAYFARTLHCSVRTFKYRLRALEQHEYLVTYYVHGERHIRPGKPYNTEIQTYCPPLAPNLHQTCTHYKTKETLRATKETDSFVCNKTNSVSPTRTGMRGQPHSGTPSVQAATPAVVPDTSESEILHSVMPQSVEVTAYPNTITKMHENPGIYSTREITEPTSRVEEHPGKNFPRVNHTRDENVPTCHVQPEYVDGAGISPQRVEKQAENQHIPNESPLLRDLEDFGVSLAASRFLASTASPDAILRTMAYCRKRGYGAGALIRAIREGWAIPAEKKPERGTVRYSLAEPQKPAERPDEDAATVAARLAIRKRLKQALPLPALY